MSSIVNLQAKFEIDTLLVRLKQLHITERIWLQILTDVEKDSIGNFATFAEQAETERFGISSIYSKLKSISTERAAVKLAFAIGMINEDTRNWLETQLGIAVRNLALIDTPEWNKQKLELHYLGEVVRKYSRSARNVITVLDAFEEESWPPRLDDPLTNGPNSLRLHATIQSLNKYLVKIHFSADGKGEGFCWNALGSS